MPAVLLFRIAYKNNTAEIFSDHSNDEAIYDEQTRAEYSLLTKLRFSSESSYQSMQRIHREELVGSHNPLKKPSQFQDNNLSPISLQETKPSVKIADNRIDGVTESMSIDVSLWNAVRMDVLDC